MYVDLKIPAGLKANGTDRQSKGFWREANLCRDYGDSVGPIAGWRNKTTSGATITGSARMMICWRDSSQGRWTGVGTHSNAYVVSASGVITDITPAGFTTGRADATTTGGYGRGAYNRGAYGTPRPDTGSIAPATVWDFDLWADELLGCSEDDGEIYYWDLNTANDFVTVTNAPTTCIGIVVTEEKILVAIFERSIQWSDQGDRTDWTPTASNQAGDATAQTSGTFRCGRAVKGRTLIFSDVDVWALTYRRDIYIYDFEKLADGCGVVSKGAALALDSRCYWMSEGAFWLYNGGQVSPIDCSVRAEVFDDINRQQISKVFALHNARHSEIWWFYPSASSTEIDRAVSYNYLNGRWWTHTLARTCGHGAAGIFQQPLMLTTANVLKEHEVGIGYDSATPHVRSGPLELGAGDRVMNVSRVIGDEHTRGDASVKFYNRPFPNGTEVATSVYPLTTTPTDIRFTSRQTEMEVQFGADTGARFGDARLELKPGGYR